MRTAFAFDLDGTITNVELLPRIAAELKLEEEIQFLTELTINNTIPFDASFKLRYALLRAVPIESIHRCVANAPLNEAILKFIHRHRDDCFVVTGNIDHWIKPILDKINCRYFASQAETDGRYCTMLKKINQKADAIQAIKQNYDRVVAIGEGANDVMMFELADVAISFGEVHAPVSTLYPYSQYLVHEGRKLCQLLDTLS